jgi:hypothetical protein
MLFGKGDSKRKSGNQLTQNIPSCQYGGTGCLIFVKPKAEVGACCPTSAVFGAPDFF